MLPVWMNDSVYCILCMWCYCISCFIKNNTSLLSISHFWFVMPPSTRTHHRQKKINKCDENVMLTWALTAAFVISYSVNIFCKRKRYVYQRKRLEYFTDAIHFETHCYVSERSTYFHLKHVSSQREINGYFFVIAGCQMKRNGAR